MKTSWLLAVFASLVTLIAPLQALDFSNLETMPVQDGGRKKPYLVFAEEYTMSLSGRSSIVLDEKKWSAMEIVTAMWVNPQGWQEEPMILIDHKPLKDAIGLESARKRFSYGELARNQKLIDLLNEAAQTRAAGKNVRLKGLLKEVSDVGMRLANFEVLANGQAFRVVPNPAGPNSPWSTIPQSASKYPEVATAFANFQQAFAGNDPTAFDQAVTQLRTDLNQIDPVPAQTQWRIELESFYQKLHPHRWAWLSYLVATVALLTTSMARTKASLRIVWLFVVIGFILQLFGFVARVIISGRAPVTNMYESVLWVAFGTIFFAIVFEAIYRSRFFLLGAMPVAIVALILADSQPAILDKSIDPLVPVLQSNFWLTTHVLTITLSYAAFALALGVGHIALFQVIRGFKPSAALYNYLYRTLQIGVLLLTVGTILGAIWANYSWGRFWDWDPKETWALIALLGYLIVLHGRVAGTWGGFGLAVGSVLAFLSVLMAWYGVNFILGVGLHSYGFGTGGFPVVMGFVSAEVAFTAYAIWCYRKLPSSSPAAASL